MLVQDVSILIASDSAPDAVVPNCRMLYAAVTGSFIHVASQDPAKQHCIIAAASIKRVTVVDVVRIFNKTSFFPEQKRKKRKGHSRIVRSPNAHRSILRRKRPASFQACLQTNHRSQKRAHPVLASLTSHHPQA